MHTASVALPPIALTTTSRPANQACLHRWDPLIWVLLPVELFDLCRLDENHVTAAAAVLAPAALPPVLADGSAAALLAIVALPPVLAEAAAAAVLAIVALPPVLADAAAAAAVLALGAPPPMLADGTATAVLALAAHPPVLANATAAAVLAVPALPPVLALLLSHANVRTSNEVRRRDALVQISATRALTDPGAANTAREFGICTARS